MEDRKIYFETDRLRISDFVSDDIDSFMEYRNDSDWMKYQGYKCLSREKYCDELLKAPDFDAGAQLAILCKDVLIGDLFLRITEETAEIGYTLNRKYTGKGYCTEAVAGLCCFLQKNKVLTVKAEVDRENTASINVLHALGFLLQGDDDGYLLYQKSI